MGQYHSIYNVTKNETIMVGGSKLWEQAHGATAAALLLLLSNSNGRGGGDFNIYPKDYDKLTPQELADKSAIDLVSGRWAGDKIVVQGDYAEQTDPGYIDVGYIDKSFVDITHLVADALLIAHDGDETDISKKLEYEISSQCLGVKGTRVEKSLSIDRNNQKVEKYHVPIIDKKKSKPRKSKKLSMVKGGGK